MGQLGPWSGVGLASGGGHRYPLILDRLQYHSDVITIRADSYRLRTRRRAAQVHQASVNPATPTNQSVTTGSLLGVVRRSILEVA